MVIQPLATHLIKPNFCFDLSHQRSTTVSLETRNNYSSTTGLFGAPDPHLQPMLLMVLLSNSKPGKFNLLIFIQVCSHSPVSESYHIIESYQLYSTLFKRKGMIPDVIPNEGSCPWQGYSTTPGTLCPRLFKQCVGSVTSHRIVNNEKIMRRGLQFLVFIQED